MLFLHPFYTSSNNLLANRTKSPNKRSGFKNVQDLLYEKSPSKFTRRLILFAVSDIFLPWLSF